MGFGPPKLCTSKSHLCLVGFPSFRHCKDSNKGAFNQISLVKECKQSWHSVLKNVSRKSAWRVLEGIFILPRSGSDKSWNPQCRHFPCLQEWLAACKAAVPYRLCGWFLSYCVNLLRYHFIFTRASVPMRSGRFPAQRLSGLCCKDNGFIWIFQIFRKKKTGKFNFPRHPFRF